MSVVANVGTPFRAVEVSRDDAPRDPRPDGWRDRRRMLDACLSALEDESEQGHRYVSADIAAVVRRAVPGVRTGDLIRDAIEMVFQEQGRACRVRAPEGAVTDVRTPGSMRREEARVLTDRIKRGFHSTTLLLLEAHSKRAWHALGYQTWEDYVRQEFSFSRSRSYQLLDHGRVLQVLMASAKLDSVPDVSAYAAAQILPRLGEVAAAVERRVTPDMDEGTVRRSLQAVVESYRAPVLQMRDTSTALTVLADATAAQVAPTTPAMGAPQSAGEMAALRVIIERSLQLPDADEVFRSIQDNDIPLLSRLADAAARLTALAEAWAKYLQAGTRPIDSSAAPCPEF
jgi:hypothetical protein